jgi:hypothetical protein
MPDADEVLDRAVALAERYGEAIVEIHNVLNDDTHSDGGKVMRARLVLAGLDPALLSVRKPDLEVRRMRELVREIVNVMACRWWPRARLRHSTSRRSRRAKARPDSGPQVHPQRTSTAG